MAFDLHLDKLGLGECYDTLRSATGGLASWAPDLEEAALGWIDQLQDQSAGRESQRTGAPNLSPDCFEFHL
ncbi:MAG: hypothetical protein ACPGNV_00160 [Mangrovicoccus sp.]